METHDCTYCGSEIEPGSGVLLVRNDGERVRFCSSKCQKNADLGRPARDVEWTEVEPESEEDG
ncbi:50S ribosomal protein L24e [Haladaptatus sp. F3-133]|jgi:large subunit ribosomal protein L24e|uniref:50S ribosomal protein L24e n=1 Tax=Halorutilus salinus TaxID=2487751 RepID=A0A9Q4GIK8_9EURY|nr:50S ribosomal protein L24e [Halorutilus salinus]MCX2818391.1 50S ribosomal protein L24e [Halorutilus salinus]